jgi:hypothetical protein
MQKLDLKINVHINIHVMNDHIYSQRERVVIVGLLLGTRERQERKRMIDKHFIYL